MKGNRFAQMAKSALPGVAGATPPRPPKMTMPAAKGMSKPVAPPMAKKRRGNVNNLGKFAHPPKMR